MWFFTIYKHYLQKKLSFKEICGKIKECYKIMEAS